MVREEEEERREMDEDEESPKLTVKCMKKGEIVKEEIDR